MVKGTGTGGTEVDIYIPATKVFCVKVCSISETAWAPASESELGSLEIELKSGAVIAEATKGPLTKLAGSHTDSAQNSLNASVRLKIQDALSNVLKACVSPASKEDSPGSKRVASKPPAVILASLVYAE